MKIDRALIIRRLNHPVSMEYAAGCAKSCEEHNLKYEFIDAIENISCEQAFKAVGVYKKESYKNSMGNCCCHASHIKCWKRIIELDKPCIILEHDAIVRGDVTNIDIPDMSVVTFGHRVLDPNQYNPIKPIKELKEIPRSVGVHACGLSPLTAKWLWESARNNGISIGIDRWLMMQRASRLPLYVSSPEQVVCWIRKSTINENKKPSGKVVNYPDSFSKYWKDGFK